MGIKRCLKEKHKDLALKVKTDPGDFIQENVCSVKNYDCCSDTCENCTNHETIHDVLVAFRRNKGS